MPRKFKHDLPEIKLIDNKTTGERISDIRKARGLTQLELSEKLGIVRATLTDYERGRSRIYDEMIIRIAKALEVSTDRLLGFGSKETEDKISLRFTKRIRELEKLPEYKIRMILNMIDDSIKANK